MPSHAEQKLKDARSLDEPAWVAHADFFAKRVEVAGDARLLNKLGALLPDAEYPLF